MSWGGSGPLGGGPFGGGGGASAGSDPLGGATEFGFSIPQGDPGEIERAAGACLARSFALSTQSENIGTATRAAVAGWEGGAQAAFSDYAGHAAKVVGANAEAIGDAGLAMTTLSTDLEHAQRVTRQAAKECATYQNALTTAQGDVVTNSSHAQTLRTQAAAAVHPQTIGELNHQAGLAQSAADAAVKAADKANGQLQIWQTKGQTADRTYQHQAQAAANKIRAAAGRIQTVASLPGGAPVPVTVSPGDIALAQVMLNSAGSLPTAAEAMGDPQKLSRLAGGRQVTPGTILSYMQQGVAEVRQEQSAGKGSLIDAAGGLVHTLSLGTVSFGNSNTARYRGGEDAGLLPVDPESLGIDGERLAAKAVEHEGEKVGEKEGERVAETGVDAATGAETLPTPQVDNPKLQNVVNNLYKGTTNPGRVGDGTTSDAVRSENQTGLPTGGFFHTTKAQESVRALKNLLARGKLSPHDRVVAQSLLDDLNDALKGGS